MPVTRRAKWSVGLSLCLLIWLITSGCGSSRSVLPNCAIERPNEDVVGEQMMEALRAYQTDEGPLLPATYEWLKRLDRDIGLWGDPE